MRNKTWGSQLRIDGVYSYDSGQYRCEVSDGSQRDSETASLTVSWRESSLVCLFVCLFVSLQFFPIVAEKFNSFFRG